MLCALQHALEPTWLLPVSAVGPPASQLSLKWEGPSKSRGSMERKVACVSWPPQKPPQPEAGSRLSAAPLHPLSHRDSFLRGQAEDQLRPEAWAWAEQLLSADHLPSSRLTGLGAPSQTPADGLLWPHRKPWPGGRTPPFPASQAGWSPSLLSPETSHPDRGQLGRQLSLGRRGVSCGGWQRSQAAGVGVRELYYDGNTDSTQVRGRDKDWAQTFCFSSGLVAANFSRSFFHKPLFMSFSSPSVSAEGKAEG